MKTKLFLIIAIVLLSCTYTKGLVVTPNDSIVKDTIEYVPYYDNYWGYNYYYPYNFGFGGFYCGFYDPFFIGWNLGLYNPLWIGGYHSRYSFGNGYYGRRNYTVGYRHVSRPYINLRRGNGVRSVYTRTRVNSVPYRPTYSRIRLNTHPVYNTHRQSIRTNGYTPMRSSVPMRGGYRSFSGGRHGR